MQRSTQFDVKTVAILLACVSLGLAARASNFSRPSNSDSWLDFVAATSRGVSGVLLYAAAAAMVVGLVQQVVFLRRASLEPPSCRFALVLAIGWRVVAAILLAGSVALEIAVSRDLIELTYNIEFGNWVFEVAGSTFLFYAVMIVVLLDTLGDEAPFRLPLALRIPLWLIIVLIALVGLTYFVYSVFLVYESMNRIEEAQRPEFQRAGAYPDFAAEGYGLFWWSLGALLFAAAGALLLMAPVALKRGRFATRVFAAALGVAFLAGSAAFGYWFLFEGFPTIAPDFAEGGWACGPREWMYALVILALAIPALAYRLISPSSPLAPGMYEKPLLPLHHSMLVSVMLAVAAVCFFIEMILTQWDAYNRWGPVLPAMPPMFWLYVDLSLFLPLGVSLLSLKLLWKQLRAPLSAAPVGVRLAAPGRFAFTCAALSLILALSVPTVFAFCFAFWVAPWS